VVVVAAALVVIVPGLRSHLTSAANRVRRDIHPHYAEIPVSSATQAVPDGCTDPSISGNATVYWYTKPVGPAAQVLTVTFAPSFKGKLDKVGVTPIAAAPGAGATLATPAPSELQVTGSSTVTPGQLVLANPPKFQSFTLKSTGVHSLQIRVLSSDPTASSSCAETAFIFYEKN